MRFILDADPMVALREQRKEKVNQSFNTISASNAHLDQAYNQKRQWAATQDERLKPEADLRGMTVAELAAVILSKPDLVAAREYERQQIMARIDAAATPAELDGI